MTTYPITLPSAPGFSRASFRMQNTVGATTSPFTRQQQVHAHQGEGWAVDLTLPPLRNPARVGQWQAALASLRGMYGTFLLGDPDFTTPRGVATGTPVAGSTIYSTWNPADKGVDVVLSNGNQRANTGAATRGAVRGTLPVDIETAARYWEFDIVFAGSASDNFGVGIANASAPLEISTTNNANKRAYHAAGSFRSGSTDVAGLATWTTGSRVAVATKNGKVWFGLVSGGVTTWLASGNPAAEANPAYSGLTGDWYPYIQDGYTSPTVGGLIVDLITNPAEMLGTVPAGFEALAPPVGENTARSRVLYTTGWTPNTTGILLRGTRLQLRSGGDARLHMLIEDVNSDSSGNAALPIWPALYTDIPDGEPIIITNAKGCFRLTSNDIGWDSDAAKVFGFSFSARSV
jgi:hypothetical protein